MKCLLGLITAALLLTVCGPPSSLEPTPVPDIPIFTEGQAIALVQETLTFCNSVQRKPIKGIPMVWEEHYQGGGKWAVKWLQAYDVFNEWEVIESSSAVRIVKKARQLPYCI